MWKRKKSFYLLFLRAAQIVWPLLVSAGTEQPQPLFRRVAKHGKSFHLNQGKGSDQRNLFPGTGRAEKSAPCGPDSEPEGGLAPASPVWGALAARLSAQPVLLQLERAPRATVSAVSRAPGSFQCGAPDPLGTFLAPCIKQTFIKRLLNSLMRASRSPQSLVVAGEGELCTAQDCATWKVPMKR